MPPTTPLNTKESPRDRGENSSISTTTPEDGQLPEASDDEIEDLSWVRAEIFLLRGRERRCDKKSYASQGRTLARRRRRIPQSSDSSNEK
mmetsp:Transcript_27185/g.80209  ORF Transcript_27185/g.80209 Transcript_27185/m.80209 type:complete len:90 (-) Transcript_27185:361-630(-)